MDIIGLIGLIITGLVVLSGLLLWVWKSGRTIGIKETELKHEDESLNDRVQRNRDDIDKIFDMLQGTEFWNQMRELLKEVKGETKRHERSQD